MDFSSFLLKKKIEERVFKAAEPLLFAEFEAEYAQMGPKSFDHTKKFLFNKLRRAYHIPEPEKAKETIEITDPVSQASTLQSPTIQQKPAYVPRFKILPKPSQP